MQLVRLSVGRFGQYITDEECSQCEGSEGNVLRQGGPTVVLKAFQLGAGGVMIQGCHPGDCHYAEGNYKAARRISLLKKVVAQFGIEDERD